MTLTPEEGSDYRMTIAVRESPGTVVAYSRSNSEAKRCQVKIGTGEPVRRLRLQYRCRVSDIGRARRIAPASAEGADVELYVSRARRCLGGIDCRHAGISHGLDGEWLVNRAEHYIGPSGYQCTIDAEQPNSAESVANINGAPIAEEIQGGTLAEQGERSVGLK
ncbi:MAG TPA: hypothetical protein VHK24_08325 [Steroidobacter sp.]|nr:hypothetical protein [Steroidobacter sp.]